ncbi:uncharacterized protein LOC108742759 isoform X2 [Agrilus planipennis]|uniref:Uncharacterized protein LOC108742759 isoform X2 n=1 Tax=Agrilus planipennis TaxID=224129 RepID=A0A1W4XC24_AGRPL|nr:uncharacterized protein LOC108742759 isoform X2 [Agrilus planipennis]
MGIKLFSVNSDENKERSVTPIKNNCSSCSTSLCQTDSKCSNEEARCSESKICKKPKITRNPFFNYLIDVRSKCKHMTAAEIACKGAKEWNNMSPECKQKYCQMAQNAPKTPRKRRPPSRRCCMCNRVLRSKSACKKQISQTCQVPCPPPTFKCTKRKPYSEICPMKQKRCKFESGFNSNNDSGSKSSIGSKHSLITEINFRSKGVNVRQTDLKRTESRNSSESDISRSDSSYCSIM